jgi:translocation and assembly module TamB
VDEVLARLLFDKSAGQVGAAEALQLAQAAAALSGGGANTGVLEEIGRKFGLDRIDVSTVETVDESGKAGEAAALSVGKDLGEDVRVGVEQGIEPGTGSVSVEVDLGKNLSVESKVGAQGRSGVGLKWEYDY